MSYHSTMEWEFEDGCTEEVIEELANGLVSNREYNQDGKFMGTYGTFNMMDRFMCNIGMALDKFDLPAQIDAAVEWIIPGASNKKVAESVLRGVVMKLNERDEL